VGHHVELEMGRKWIQAWAEKKLSFFLAYNNLKLWKNKESSRTKLNWEEQQNGRV